MTLDKDIIAWIVTEGMAGTENQCLGVAESLQITAALKRIRLRQPWKTLSPYLGFECACTFDPPLEGPWPHLLIASGRKSIAASRYIKKQSGGQTFTVQIQDPRVAPSQFDLVAVAAHDPARGDNVIVTTGAPNRITPEKLAQAAQAFPQLQSFIAARSGPAVAVLVGGDSRDYAMSHQVTDWLIEAIASHDDAAFMVTLSRRTPKKYAEKIRSALTRAGHYVWDEYGENPYLALLALADYVMVTSDSVSMASDAATAGKPIYILGLERRRPDNAAPPLRVETFHQLMAHKGITRPFAGVFDPPWHYAPLRDADLIAREIERRMTLKG